MTSIEKKEYQKRYYQEKLKKKRQEKKNASVCQSDQPTLFDSMNQSILTVNKFDSLTNQFVKLDESKNQILTVDGASNHENQIKNKRKISISREINDCNLTFDLSKNQLPKIGESTYQKLMVDENQPIATTQLDFVASQFADVIKEIAFKKLLPNATKKMNIWVIFELIALAILSCFVLVVSIKTLKSIADEIFLLVIAVETVSVFFSFSLQKSKGLGLFLKVLVLTACIGVTNHLIISNVILQADHEKQRKHERYEKIIELKNEIVGERATIVDLQARGRLTAAEKHTDRLDSLRKELSQLQNSDMGLYSDKMTILQIIMRIILSVSMFIINHQISEIFSSKRFLKLSI